MTAEDEALVLKPPSDGKEVKVRVELILMDLQKRDKRPEWLERTRHFKAFAK